MVPEGRVITNRHFPAAFRYLPLEILLDAQSAAGKNQPIVSGGSVLLKIRTSCRLLFSIAVVAALVHAQSACSRPGEYRDLTLSEFSPWLESKDFLLINVHVPYQGEIPQTDLLLPYHSIQRLKDRLPPAKDSKIVVYCMTGPMGHDAAQSLVSLGYTRVYHFAGGMRDWVRSGRHLIYRSDR